MPTYEVFLKPVGRDGFAHAGSLDAPDDDFALVLARETYVRRGEGELAWVVRRSNVLVLDPDDLAVTAARAHSINDGHVVADRRKDRRISASQTTSNQSTVSQLTSNQTTPDQTMPNQTMPNRTELSA
jgi:phenylacetate-CoA oxygenase PaaH subunit